MSKERPMSEDQIRALFRAQDPAAHLSLADLTEALLTFDEILDAKDQEAPRPVRWRGPSLRRRVVVIAVAILALALLTAAAWVYLATRPSSAPLSARCYESLDADSQDIIIDVPTGSTPKEACASRWSDLWHSPKPDAFVVCIIQPGGATGVLPNPDGLELKDACLSIGGLLPEPDALYGGLSAEQVRQLNADLASWIDTNTVKGCAGGVDLATEVQGELDAIGADVWSIDDRTAAELPWVFPDGNHEKVQAARAPDGQICAYYSVDSKHQRVVLMNDWPHVPEESGTTTP